MKIIVNLYFKPSQNINGNYQGYICGIHRQFAGRHIRFEVGSLAEVLNSFKHDEVDRFSIEKYTATEDSYNPEIHRDPVCLPDPAEGPAMERARAAADARRHRDILDSNLANSLSVPEAPLESVIISEALERYQVTMRESIRQELSRPTEPENQTQEGNPESHRNTDEPF